MYRWRKIILIFMYLCCATVGIFAQERTLQNKPFIDERRFHYGFTFGLHDQGLKLQNNGFIDPSTGAQWLAENDRMNMGFTVGVLGEWKINNYMALRLIPSLHFGSKHISFRNVQSGEKLSQDMKSTYVSLPLDLKVAAPRFNNYRPYVIAGAQPMYDLTASKHTKLQTKAFNMMLEVGMGCDFYLPFFKLIPELKFCFGLGNVLNKHRNDLTNPADRIFTQSIDRATTNMFVLSFYFE